MYLIALSAPLETVSNAAIEITNPPQLDLSITISVIVAIVAIISPILTALINNRHQLKLKKMEMNEKAYEDSVLYKRNILQSYLQHAGTCIVHSNHDSLREYGKYYLLALMYVPDELAEKMKAANYDIREYNWGTATKQMETITMEIKQLLANM